MAVRGEIAQQRMMRHRDAMGEAGRAAAILQIGDFLALRLRQVARHHITRDEIFESDALDILLAAGFARHLFQFLGEEEQHRVAAVELDIQLIDIAFLAAKAGRQRERHRPSARIDDAEEELCEIRARFGHQCHAILRLHAMGDQAMGAGDGIGAQF